MRHRKSGRKLNMDSSARKAMFRNMVTSLMLHGQIKTTVARAKELRRHAERVITIGKKAPSATAIDGLKGDAQRQARADRVAAIRRVRRWVNNDEALGLVFDEYAERFRARPGGYTRVLKAGFRAGDNAPMAVIQLVGDFDPNAKPAKAAPVEEPAAEETVAEEPAAEEAPAEETVAADEEATQTEDQVVAADDEEDADDEATVVDAVVNLDDEAEGEVVEEE